MSLRNKRILITAGPTWVPIDRVRVIANIATGETGIILADKLKRLGAKVTLVLGPVEACCLDSRIKLKCFRFFNELKDIVLKELKSRKYDIVIHSAAVSDYKPLERYGYKIKSGIKGLKLNLVPTAKIIDSIKKIDRSVFLVGFKFEPAATKNILIQEARKLMRKACLDLAVANSVDRNRYAAYILEPERIHAPALHKKDLAEKLVSIIVEKFRGT